MPPHARRTALLALILTMSALAAPPAKPDFSGKWTLNAQKSELGPVPAPKSRVEDVTQKEDKLKVVRVQTDNTGKSTTLTLSCTIGGPDCASDFTDPDVKIGGKTHWDGDVLVFDLTITTANGQLQMNDRYTRAVDGKTIVIKRHITSIIGSLDQTLVMEKS